MELLAQTHFIESHKKWGVSVYIKDNGKQCPGGKVFSTYKDALEYIQAKGWHCPELNCRGGSIPAALQDMRRTTNYTQQEIGA